MISLDVNSVADNFTTVLEFSKEVKNTTSWEQIIADCFSFKGKKSKNPEMVVQSINETILILDPVADSFSSKESEITLSISDCFNILSVEKAGRMKQHELVLENGYIEPEEEQ